MDYPRFIGKIKDKNFYLTDEESHHARVRRIKEGYKVEINDLSGNVYLGIVEKVGKKEITGRIIQKLPVSQSQLEIQLFLAMPNRLSKIDDLMEPITELGVKELIPVISKNTAVKKSDILKKIPKWEKISLNSIKQCKRLFPIEIKEPILVKEIKTDADIKVVFYEKEKIKTLKDFLGRKIEKVAIYIGSEGGITEDEIALLKEKGFITLTLGELILRMETAVISGICQVNFVFG